MIAELGLAEMAIPDHRKVAPCDHQLPALHVCPSHAEPSLVKYAYHVIISLSAVLSSLL